MNEVLDAVARVWPLARDRAWRRWAAGYRLGRDRSRESALAALERLPADVDVLAADAQAEKAASVRRAMRSVCIAAVAIADGDHALVKDALGLLVDIAVRLGATERKVRRRGR